MKKRILLFPILILSLVFTGCSDDDDPAPVEELEVITTVVVTLTDTNNVEYEMRWEDPDYAVGNITAGYSGVTSIPEGFYSGEIQLYNNTLPIDDEEYIVTNEILEAGEGGDIDHLFFYSGLGGLVLNSLAYEDSDVNGDPIGQQFSLVGVAGTGELSVMLVHEPEKDADGMPDDVWNGVGEDEVNLQFPLTISTQ